MLTSENRLMHGCNTPQDNSLHPTPLLDFLFAFNRNFHFGLPDLEFGRSFGQPSIVLDSKLAPTYSVISAITEDVLDVTFDARNEKPRRTPAA
jgi:hypothetical protein